MSEACVHPAKDTDISDHHCRACGAGRGAVLRDLRARIKTLEAPFTSEEINEALLLLPEVQTNAAGERVIQVFARGHRALAEALNDARRAHATELAHVSMSEREADAARIADLERRLDESDRAHGRTIEQRDTLESWSEDLHAALGCDHEASNLHDYFSCIRHNALTLQSHYESAERDAAELLAARAVVAQARNVSPRICGAAGILNETVKAYDAVVNKGHE